MLDERPQADRILIAQLHGEAKHQAKWRELTEDEDAAAVAVLREVAAGRGDLQPGSERLRELGRYVLAR